MDQEIITQDGEVLDALPGVAMAGSMAVQLQKAEIDQQITTARQYPRSLKRVQSAIMSMATLDEESAEECIYALPRGGKPIRGPSIRFAEILKQSYGNCRAGARVVHVDTVEMYVEAEGVFHDLETNSQSTARVRRRISDKKGKVFNSDMIIVTGNAACSIAMRNAILAGVPKPLWRRAYETVQATITGDVTTLSENREKAFKALAAFGVKPELVFQALGVEGVEDISVDHIATLRGMYSALKNGEATVEEMFVGTVKPASDHQKVANPLADDNAASATGEPAGAREGFSASHVASEAATLTGEPEIQSEPAPVPSPTRDSAVESMGNPAVPSGVHVSRSDGAVVPLTDPVAASLSADEAEQPAHAAAPEAGADGSEERAEPGSASAPALSAADRADIIKRYLTLAGDAKGIPDTRERFGRLTEIAEDDIGRIGDHAKDFIRNTLERSRSVIKGELTAAKAREFLEALS